MALFVLECEGCEREVMAKLDPIVGEFREPLPEGTMYAFDRISNRQVKWALTCYCGGSLVASHDGN